MSITHEELQSVQEDETSAPLEPMPLGEPEPQAEHLDAGRAAEALWERFADVDEGAIDLATVDPAIEAQAPHGPKTEAENEQHERALVRRYRGHYVRLQGRIARAKHVQEGFLAGNIARDALVRFVDELAQLIAALAPLDAEQGPFAMQVKSVRFDAQRIKARLAQTLADNPPLPDHQDTGRTDTAERVPPKENRKRDPSIIESVQEVAEKRRIDREHPARRTPGGEAVLRPAPAKPKRTTLHHRIREDEANRAELFAAAHIARVQKYIVATSKKKEPEIAIAAARKGCEAAAHHLNAVTARTAEGGVTDSAFVDAWATCGFLLDEIADLDPERTAASVLQNALAHLVPPPNWKPPSKQIQQRIARLQKPAEDREYLRAVSGPLDRAREILDATTDTYRDGQVLQGPDKRKRASDKPERFEQGAALAAPHLKHAIDAIRHGTFDSDRARLQPAIDACFAAAERFVRFCMHEDPFADLAATRVRELSMPLAAWSGRSPLVVEKLVRREADKTKIVNAKWAIMGSWLHAFRSRSDTLDKLAERPEPPVKIPWQRELLAAVIQISAATMVGAVAGAAGAVLAAKAGSEIVQGILANGTETLVTELVGRLPKGAKPADVRKQFFLDQKDVFNDQSKAHAELIDRLIAEASVRPDAVELLADLHSAIDAKSKEIGTKHAQQCVQDWAIYQARAVHGLDRGGGVDMTGVGRGISEDAVEPTDVAMPTGVLELDVELATTGKPRIVRALAGGMREDDLATLTHNRQNDDNRVLVGDLRMPTQFRIYGAYGGRRVREGGEDKAHELPLGDFTHAAHLVVSRNEAGVLWLRDASAQGRAYITRKYGGDPASDGDVLRGAARLVAELANVKLSHVEAA